MSFEQILAGGAVLLTTLATGEPARADSASTAPVVVHGYRFALALAPSASTGGSEASVNATFLKVSGNGFQSHQFVATGGATRVRLSRDHESATVVAKWGAAGGMRMKMRNALRIKTPPFANCTGQRPRTYRGTLRGWLRLSPDTGFFGTFKRTHFVASVLTGGALRCKSEATHESLRLQPLLSDRSVNVRFSRLSDGVTRQRVDVESVPASHVTVMHQIEQRGDADAVSFSPDSSSASVAGIGPGFSGSLSWLRTGTIDAQRASGRLEGNLTAVFDSVAPLQLAAGTPAILTRMR